MEFIAVMQNWLQQHPTLRVVLIIFGVLLLSWIVFLITKHYLVRFLARLAQKSKTNIDDIILERVISRRLAYIAPILVLYYFSDLLPELEGIVRPALFAVIVLVLLLSFGAFINLLHEILQRLPAFRNKPIKGYVQVIKLIVYLFGFILIFSVLTGISPIGLLSGLGAMTAVLLLIFRDTILSFVASININSSDLVQVGDWIEVRKYGADGDVTDIALHTIKIQNWDKTFTVIPTHKLLEETFRNWRGMKQSGGRRIKRAIHIDISSIKFCDERMVEKFKKIHLLKDYIEQKTKEIETYNKEHNFDENVLVNGRRMTNIGTFRAYIEIYLRHHDRINQNLTFLIRQLPPGDNGLPIEIYVFSNDVVWKNYEAIQADIFDHLLAVAPEFELRIFQKPSGYDLSTLGEVDQLAQN
jgi:miniconductance mechanosensitive channel